MNELHDKLIIHGRIRYCLRGLKNIDFEEETIRRIYIDEYISNVLVKLAQFHTFWRNTNWKFPLQNQVGNPIFHSQDLTRHCDIHA